MTGGRSFIGSALLKRLEGDGHEVAVIGPQHGSGEVRHALRGEARLVLLGFLTTGPSRSTEVAAAIGGDVAVNRMALRAARGIASHIVYASSTSVYGLPERVPITETDRTFPLDPYARAKLASERAVRRAGRALGVTVTILRYATVYGPGETPSNLVRRFVRAAIDGTAPEIDGDGFDEDDYVYVDDVVEATMRAIEQRADSTYNIGTGVGTSSLTLARAVLELAQLDVEPVLRPRRKERARIVCSTARAAGELGFNAWPNLHRGIQNEIAWVRQTLLNEFSIGDAQAGSR